jgi:hypothetical protein
MPLGRCPKKLTVLKDSKDRAEIKKPVDWFFRCNSEVVVVLF